MSLELRGLLAAVAAGLAALGLTFGLAAVIRAHAPISPQRATQTAMEVAGANPEAVLVARGQDLYTASCARCHGSQGQGAMGPSLHHEDETDTQIAGTIKNGVPNAMPAFGTRYKDPDIKALTAYIRSLK